MTKIIQVENLKVGQEVALANCRETGNVVCRVAKNLYRVEWKGQLIDMPRFQLGVYRDGRWQFGPVNAN